jgi:hypothetical protein
MLTTRYQQDDMNTQTKEMRGDEPHEPEPRHSVDSTTMQSDTRPQGSYDLIAGLCVRFDHLVGKTRDKSGRNQVVSRVIAYMQACMKASIVTHLGFCLPSAQAA